MPELPEVARTATSLHNRIANSTLESITIHSGRYSRHGNPKGFDEFVKNLPAKVEKVSFSGKLLVFYLKDRNGKPWWIWNTLGMSGGWRLEAGKHSHVEFRTSKGTVWFNDPRNFGTLKFVDNEAETLKKINSIGPNHLQMEISDDLFKSRLMLYPKVTLAQSLMSQSLIGGVGNYIKAEALYRAKLSPHRLVETLTDEEFSRLNAAVREVILGSFDNGGASISTYYQIDGSEGKFPFFFMVYGRNICHNGYQVVTETTLDGRTTHWVPELQN